MVAENCQSKNPYFEGRIVLFVIIFSFDLFFVVFCFIFQISKSPSNGESHQHNCNDFSRISLVRFSMF